MFRRRKPGECRILRHKYDLRSDHTWYRVFVCRKCGKTVTAGG